MTSDEKEIMVKFSAPLNRLDTENRTVGCRHSNPEICKNMYVVGICAFADADRVCKRPSSSWKKHYKKLKEDQ